MNTLSTSLQRTSVWARGLAALGLVAGAWALTAIGSQAHARSDVYWSVGVSGPGVTIGASNAPVVVHQPPVYYQPPAYYYAPAPVVVQPAPVYYHRPRPVVVTPPVVYAPRPVVIGGPGYWRERPGRWNHDHGHRHDHSRGRGHGRGHYKDRD